jgi:hypothetical protein
VPFDDRTTDGTSAVRSLSEQLRDLEAQLCHENELSLPRIARRSKLPTHLGRPIGLVRPEGFPRLSSLTADLDERSYQPEAAPSPGAAFRRGATIVGVGLLLLATTAIVPPLFLHHPVPQATPPQIPDQLVTPQRTERFAQSARELRDAGPAAFSSPPPPPPQAQPVLTQPAAAARPAPPPATAHLHPTITLAVSENESARLDLPTIVTGMGSASTVGSAVVIDGLPDGTRVSHGIPIARDSWTVASSDVDSAVVFLPRNTPARLDLHVRVVAADSQELAANTLEIRVLRATDVTAPIVPATDIATAHHGAPPATARFEPAAAEGQAAPDFIVSPPLRKPALPRSARSPTWPTATSAWTLTSEDTPPPSATVEQPPPWAPFGSQ